MKQTSGDFNIERIFIFALKKFFFFGSNFERNAFLFRKLEKLRKPIQENKKNIHYPTTQIYYY